MKEAAAPLPARKRAEFARDQLVALIREGHFRDGEKLPTEPQLSAMFSVGRSSVREAVQALVGLGLIELRPGRGAYVRQLSVNDIVQMIDGAVRLERGAALQIHEARAMIEITAARLAAARRTESDLAAMRDALIRYRVADLANNPDGLIEADLTFHQAIVQATHNDVLIEIRRSIAGLLREHRRQFGVAHELDKRPEVIAGHERLMTALTAGDVAAATWAMQDHMRTIWQQIERLANANGQSAGVHAGEGEENYRPLYDEPPAG